MGFLRFSCETPNPLYSEEQLTSDLKSCKGLCDGSGTAGNITNLQEPALLVMDRHGHLHVLWCLLFPLVKLPMDQGNINIIPNISCNTASHPVLGCDCPLMALAACHRRGKLCNRLSLFSPLFCARAWRCLRLGLAFRVVDIPQSGLLAQIISLR